MYAIVKLDGFQLHELQPGLIDKGGGLEEVTGAFAAKVGFRYAMKLGVSDFRQTLPRGLVARSELAEKEGDFPWVSHLLVYFIAPKWPMAKASG